MRDKIGTAFAICAVPEASPLKDRLLIVDASAGNFQRFIYA